MLFHFVALFLAFACVHGKTALLIIDVQDCFLEANSSNGAAGTLAVPASQIIPLINEIRANKSCLFDMVVFSQDYHPVGHVSFASTHGVQPYDHLAGKGELQLQCLNGMTKSGSDACCPKAYLSGCNHSTELCAPDGWYDTNGSAYVKNNSACTICKDTPDQCHTHGQAMWPDHCVIGPTGDATFPPSLDKREGDIVVQKGSNVYMDSCSTFLSNSAFEGDYGHDETTMNDQLQSNNITDLYVVGIATDYCVLSSVQDALGNQTGAYKVTLIKDATAAVLGDVANYDDAIAKMQTAGATIVTVADVLAMQCPVTPLQFTSGVCSTHPHYAMTLTVLVMLVLGLQFGK